MALEITTYNFKGDRNIVNKTNYLTEIVTFDVTTVEPYDDTTPIVRLDLRQYYRDIDARTWDRHKTYIGNYVKLNNKYYYVINTRCVSQGVFDITLELDNLFTYNTLIRQLRPFVTRNENEYNDYIEDNLLPLEFDKTITEYALKSGVDVRFYYNFLSRSQKVLTVVNDSALIDDYVDPISDIYPTIWRSNFAEYKYVSYMVEGDQILKNIDDYFQQHEDLLSGVVSLISLPISLDVESAISPIKVMSTTTTLRGHYVSLPLHLNIPIVEFVIRSHHENFLDLAPYTHIELYLPYYGWIELSPNQVLDRTLLLSYSVNLIDGSAFVFLADTTGTNNKLLFGSTCQLGVMMGITTKNNQEINDARLKTATNMALTALGGSVAIGAGIASLNPVVTAGGIATVAGGIIQGIAQNSTLHERANLQISGGNSGHVAPQQVRVRITRSVPITDNNFKKRFGKPLNQTTALSTLTGFTTCLGNTFDWSRITLTEGIELPNKRQQEEIEQQLIQGVIL